VTGVTCPGGTFTRGMVLLLVQGARGAPDRGNQMTDQELFSRLEVISEHGVTVYDRPRTEAGARVIGSAGLGAHGPEAHRPHYSLAEAHAARVDGEFATVGDAVRALIADHESK
jgi:hypothetical protein